jgi:hypothetical protein
MQPSTELTQTTKLNLTLEHLADAEKNLTSFISNEKRQNSFASAICAGIVNDLQSKREIIKIAIARINAI